MLVVYWLNFQMIWVLRRGLWSCALGPGLGDLVGLTQWSGCSFSFLLSSAPLFPFYYVGSVRAEVGRAHTLPGVVGICWPRRILVGGLEWPPCTRGSGLWEVWSHSLTLTGLSRWRVLKQTVGGSLLKASVILGVVYVGKCERTQAVKARVGTKRTPTPAAQFTGVPGLLTLQHEAIVYRVHVHT